MTIRAPEGYSDEAVRNPDGGATALLSNPDNFFQFQVEQDNTFGDADPDVFAENRLGSVDVLERLPDVVIDGQAAYQLTGPEPIFDGSRYEFGLRYDGYDIFIYLSSPFDTPQAQRDATNASVLASVTLP